MPCVITHAMKSCMHHMACAHRQAGHPYKSMACCNLIIYLLFMQAEGLLLKLTASHFNTLSNKIANETVMEMILIAM